MGACCCGCFKDISGGGSTTGDSGSGGETEMKNVNSNGSANSPKLGIARPMTEPSIHITKCLSKISGHGLALAGCIIEQDSAYWEWHIVETSSDEAEKVEFGVATKKNRAFYRQQSESEQPPREGEEGAGDKEVSTNNNSNGREYMQEISVKKDDTIAICVQQSDLPMIQFMLNGELLHELAINRFRGSVYPSVYIPQSSSSSSDEAAAADDKNKTKVNLVMDESKFRELSPGPKFGPVIVARALV